MECSCPSLREQSNSLYKHLVCNLYIQELPGQRWSILVSWYTRRPWENAAATQSVHGIVGGGILAGY